METLNYFEISNFGADESMNKVHKFTGKASLTANDVLLSSNDVITTFADSVKFYRNSLNHKIELLRNENSKTFASGDVFYSSQNVLSNKDINIQNLYKSAPNVKIGKLNYFLKVQKPIFPFINKNGEKRLGNYYKRLHFFDVLFFVLSDDSVLNEIKEKNPIFRQISIDILK